MSIKYCKCTEQENVKQEMGKEKEREEAAKVWMARRLNWRTDERAEVRNERVKQSARVAPGRTESTCKRACLQADSRRCSRRCSRQCNRWQLRANERGAPGARTTYSAHPSRCVGRPRVDCAIRDSKRSALTYECNRRQLSSCAPQALEFSTHGSPIASVEASRGAQWVGEVESYWLGRVEAILDEERISIIDQWSSSSRLLLRE